MNVCMISQDIPRLLCCFALWLPSIPVSPVPVVHSLKLEGDVANSTSEVRADGGTCNWDDIGCTFSDGES